MARFGRLLGGVGGRRHPTPRSLGVFAVVASVAAWATWAARVWRAASVRASSALTMRARMVSRAFIAFARSAAAVVSSSGFGIDVLVHLLHRR